jgi:hypothetical protein
LVRQDQGALAGSAGRNGRISKMAEAPNWDNINDFSDDRSVAEFLSRSRVKVDCRNRDYLGRMPLLNRL